MMKNIKDNNSTQPTPVDFEIYYKICNFLNYEYRLLDEERLNAWIGLMAEDIHYWMPGIENRRRENPLQHGFYAEDHMAFFDDRLRDLKRRVARFEQPSAWAENPATRNVHTVSNIEAYESDCDNEFVVHSVIQSVRSRGLDEQSVIYGRRKDILVRDADSFKIKSRLILIPNATLTCKNINTFL